MSIRMSGPRVWITRAQPGADRTADRLAALGFAPVVAPLLEIQAIEQAEPDLEGVDVLAFTSINGVAAFAALTARRDRPVMTVGDATAQAARAAGFVHVRSAAGDLSALADLIAAQASGLVLAPGAETPAGDIAAEVAARRPEGVAVRTLAVYRAEPVEAATPQDVAAVLVHSPRAGALLAARGEAAVAGAVVACISPAAAAPLIAIGLSPAVAAAPHEDALIATLQAALGKPGRPV